MADDILALLKSLLALIEEESALLAIGKRHDIASIARSKARLAGALEAAVVERQRTMPDWQAALDPDARDALGDAMVRLAEAARANAAALQRQIDLSDEILAAIAQDAARRRGGGSIAYGGCGSVAMRAMQTPIALNASF